VDLVDEKVKNKFQILNFTKYLNYSHSNNFARISSNHTHFSSTSQNNFIKLMGKSFARKASKKHNDNDEHARAHDIKYCCFHSASQMDDEISMKSW
jgi:hypothetical protein